MIYVVLSILCSVCVGVVLKYAKQNNKSIAQIIATNYVAAFFLNQIIFKPTLFPKIETNIWAIVLILGLLLPLVFIFQAKAIAYSGIVKTDIAQRLSLLLSLLGAFFFFHETITFLKVLGLFIALLAVIFTLNKQSKSTDKEIKTPYLLLVLLGFGIIDLLFKKTATITTLPFTTLLQNIFFIALLVAWCIVIYSIRKKQEKFNYTTILWGLSVGILNFSNIYFYIKAHQAVVNNPSIIFISMNMGVIILGTLVGKYLFKEKLSQYNYIGIVLALFAIYILFLSK